MITRNDCLILLADLENKNINTQDQVNNLLTSNTIPLSVIKFINDNRELDLTRFYEKLRKSYNNKKSQLYINIVKEISEPTEVLTTLSAMLTQILLFSKNVDNRQMFLRHARFQEISKVLNIYANTYDITNCIKLLHLIKADLKAVESIKE